MEDRILAFDVGEARVGLAVSGVMDIMAEPLEVVAWKGNWASLVERIKHWTGVYAANRFLLGLPRNMDGTEGAQARYVRSFAKRLRKYFPESEIVFWDERLSSRMSERLMSEAGVYGKKRRRRVDKVSAAVILQAYMDFQKHHATKTEDSKENPLP